MTTILLLCASNVMMTFAWYWHLKAPEQALWKVILISWGIAFFEYCLAVPANRIGFVSGTFTAAQLKVVQEVITLAVFALFALFYLGEQLRWNYFAAFACLIGAVYFIFQK
ncbi:DMT family protein [Ferrovibrio sp.]|uniref:DMT family protein n=1 Tax=Ferrovibrio sp. TaxID=1917215 RepID=UPI00311DE79F